MAARVHNMPPKHKTHRRTKPDRRSHKIKNRATPRPPPKQKPKKKESQQRGGAGPQLRRTQVAEGAGWWKVSGEMRANAEPITSQTAALTNIKNNGSRHEASISESAIGL